MKNTQNKKIKPRNVGVVLTIQKMRKDAIGAEKEFFDRVYNGEFRIHGHPRKLNANDVLVITSSKTFAGTRFQVNRFQGLEHSVHATTLTHAGALTAMGSIN